MTMLHSLALSAAIAASPPVPTVNPALPEGRYGMELWVASATKVPVLGEIHGQSVSWLLVDVEHDGHQTWQHQRVCDIVLLDAFDRSRASFAPGFVDSLAPRRIPITTTDGYRADFGIDHIGYDPDEPLPERADSPGVFDFDDDGHPGATVRLDLPFRGTAEMYIAQRGHMRLAGVVGEDAGVAGTVDILLLEQRTLGASMRLLDRSPPVRPIIDRSGFSMGPVPANTDCNSLKATLCGQGVARDASCERRRR